MNPEALALFIPIMALAIPFYAMWIRHKKELMRMQIEAGSQHEPRDAARVAELEERVRVLERIVTDGGYDVAKQIEALRDQRRVDELIDDRTKSVG